MENHTNPVARTGETLVKDVNKLKTNVVQIAQDVRDHASAHVDDKKQRVQAAFQSAQEQINAHPLTLLAIGVFVGFLLGVRFNRNA
jgi:ElaB/YqjD/DUF883 family membrane-anchored ribosome-binding protein